MSSFRHQILDGVSRRHETLHLTPRAGGLRGISFGLRATCLTLLLVVELLSLTFSYDTGSLHGSSQSWQQLIQFAPRLMQLCIAMVTAACLAGRARLRFQWQQFSSAAAADREWTHWLFFHFVSFILLTITSSWLFSNPELPEHLATIITIEWGLSAMGAGICWMRAVAPFGSWKRMATSERRALFWGACVAAGSILLVRTSQSFWEPLSEYTLIVVALLLCCTFSDVVVEHSLRLVGTSRFHVEIAPQCSGYEGIGLVLMFLLIFTLLFRSRLRFPQAWLLWPMGVAAIWICNACRIALLIAVGTCLSPEIAMGGFHSQAGWIFFNVVSLGLAWMALRSPFFARTTPGAKRTGEHAPTPAYVTPLMVLMALNLVVAAFTAGFDWGYPIKIAGAACVLICFLPQVSEMKFFVAASPNDHRAEISQAPVLDRLFPLIIGAVVFAIWVPLLQAGRSALAAPMPVELVNASSFLAVVWILSRIFGSVLVIPWVEEIAFRGYLMRRLDGDRFEDRPYSTASWQSVLLSSLLFGLMHQAWFAGTLAGIAYALASRRRNSLFDAIVAHAVTNGLIAVTVLTCDAWWLW